MKCNSVDFIAWTTRMRFCRATRARAGCQKCNVIRVSMCNVLYYTGAYCAVLKFIVISSCTILEHSVAVMLFHVGVYFTTEEHVIICCSIPVYTVLQRNIPYYVFHYWNMLYSTEDWPILLRHAVVKHTITLHCFLHCFYLL